MTTDPNSPKPGIPANHRLPNGAIANSVDSLNSALTAEEIAAISQNNLVRVPETRSPSGNSRLAGVNSSSASSQTPRVLVLLLATIVMFAGLTLNNFWIGSAGSLVALAISLQILWVPLRRLLVEFIPEQERAILLGVIFGVLSLLGFLQITGVFRRIGSALANLGWDAIGALGEVLGAVGQILIAILAVYVAWRQYIISRDLTIQQNTITQQQTIDAYFQGVSELVLDEEGLLEDWPQERAIAEGRTAAILSSVDASGKAKVIRFLSRARLLSPLRRDLRLGRAILDGTGGYEEDRVRGVRVIDLGVMLAGADLAGTDLRWTDLSEANLIRANLSRSDLVKANLARTILCDAKLRYADLNGTRFFYGKPEDATPRSRIEPPDYRSGKHTGAVVEGADFTEADDMSNDQRYYCCAWGGAKTRSTIPGGCEGIPNKLGR
ncbi:MAG: pentapeptide repeat-containing protein [Leptolyngbyaceae cyanobacterium bins.302]|nr:pentapeptide repeat-containing protein [Leptolyngbyaceae cyanobacterium bins.302]